MFVLPIPNSPFEYAYQHVGLVTWPAYTEQNDQYLRIGQKLEVKKGVKESYVAPPKR